MFGSPIMNAVLLAQRAAAAASGTLVEIAIRTAAGAGRALPAGCDEFYYQTGNYSGGTGVGFTQISGVPATWSNTQGVGAPAAANLADTRLDGMAQIQDTDGIKFTGLPASFNFECCWSRNDFGFAAGLKLYDSAGTLLYTSPSAQGDNVNGVDAAGNVRSAATFLANSAKVAVTLPLGNGILQVRSNGGVGPGALPINWVRITS